jgi:hypothetical protein
LGEAALREIGLLREQLPVSPVKRRSPEHNGKDFRAPR